MIPVPGTSVPGTCYSIQRCRITAIFGRAFAYCAKKQRMSCLLVITYGGEKNRGRLRDIIPARIKVHILKICKTQFAFFFPLKVVSYARFFGVRKWTLFAPSVCNLIFELPCWSVGSYARLYVITCISLLSYYADTTRTTYDTRYRYHVPGIVVASSSLQQVPRSYCCTKRVTPLESSHGHHLPTRAASARAARGRCFDPKRAATAPGCRACSASPEHRVGSL